MLTYKNGKKFPTKNKTKKEKASDESADLQDSPKNSKGARIWCQDFPSEGQG